MAGTNEFNREELTRWFLDNYECAYCKQNHWDCFHHCVGRGAGGSKCERSILNAIPINNHICHLPNHGKLRAEFWTIKLLQWNMRNLLSRGYIFNDLDKEFIIKYKKYYD